MQPFFGWRASAWPRHAEKAWRSNMSGDPRHAEKTWRSNMSGDPRRRLSGALRTRLGRKKCAVSSVVEKLDGHGRMQAGARPFDRGRGGFSAARKRPLRRMRSAPCRDWPGQAAIRSGVKAQSLTKHGAANHFAALSSLPVKMRSSAMSL